MHCCRHLVCTVVVDGLDNFRVGGITYQPTTDDLIYPDSYTVCADQNTHIVSNGFVLNVTCGTAVSSRHIIIQSLDAVPERLCIAEVEMYEHMTGQYATTFVFVPGPIQ